MQHFGPSVLPLDGVVADTILPDLRLVEPVPRTLMPVLQIPGIIGPVAAVVVVRTHDQLRGHSIFFLP